MRPDPTSTDALSGLARRAAAGEVHGEAFPRMPVRPHLERPDDLVTSEAWRDAVLANDVEIDGLGPSCYPERHGSGANWIPTVTALAEEDLDL